jgi:hypothetical protein
MSLPIRRSCAAIAAGVILSAFALAASVPVYAQQSSGSAWMSLDRHSATGMSGADAARVHAEDSAIIQEAAFFGYDLSLKGWQHDQISCPFMPGDILLHYRRTRRDGSLSLFTATVPRGRGRVQVVPVLYGNATPFKTAVGSERSFSVFNRAIPPLVAEKELASGGSWLRLGLCYAAIAGAEPRVPRDTDTNPALVRAPAPTLRISEKSRSIGVSFTDRNAPHQYTVWDLAFDGYGRIVAASTTSLSDYAARAVNGKAPRQKLLPAPARPEQKPTAPESTPKAEPIPQQGLPRA